MKDRVKKINKMCLILIAAFCLGFSPNTISLTQAESDDVTIKGHVFLDTNNNTLRDEGEPGIPGVVISDQIKAVVTDQNGSYQIDSSGGLGIVFISIPNDYSSEVSFWKPIETKSDQFHADFPLKKERKVDHFTFIHASDPHLSKSVLPRFNKFKAIVAAREPDFVLMTGDLLHDALRVNEEKARAYFELYKGEIEKLPVPVWNVPGNHELFGVERDYSFVNSSHPLYGKKMYRFYLGPDYYSFNYGGVHFIALNTVHYHKIWYYGHINETQLSWLKADLDCVPSGTPIVTFNHIPFYSAVQSILGYVDSMRSPLLIKIDGKSHFRHTVSNASAALDLLKNHNFILALAGHNHSRESLSYELEEMRVRFNQTSAILGDVTYKGMCMISGVTLYEVRDGEIDDGEFIPIDKTKKEHK